MVPTEFRKSLCIAAGLVTLLEALVWGAGSVYGIGAFNCAWGYINVDQEVSVWTMFITTYLLGGCRDSNYASTLGFTSPFIPPTSASSSLQIWLWTNAILSAIWIPSCLLLIVAVSAEVKGKNGALLYYPWQTLTVVLIVFDFVGTIYHAGDIFQTTTPDNYAKFTYSTSWSNLTLGSSSDGIITWLPSMFVTLFFCRLLIIWIINIFLVLEVNKASHAVSLYKTKNLQSTPATYNGEKITSWRDMFIDGPDLVISQNQTQFGPGNFQIEADEDQSRYPDYSQQQYAKRQELPHNIYRIEESGNQIEDLSNPNQRSMFNLNKENSPQSPYQQRRNVSHIARPATPDSFNEHWQDIPPPMTGEIKIPPELSRVRPFSYTAGDQPQIMKVNISRSSSRAEFPPIPRPDYTIAERRAASLEYIPNRFKVPAPKRPTQLPDLRPPNQSKQAPLPPSKPQKRTIPVAVEAGLAPRSKYNPQQSKTFYKQQTSQNNDYNINKLY